MYQSTLQIFEKCIKTIIFIFNHNIINETQLTIEKI